MSVQQDFPGCDVDVVFNPATRSNADPVHNFRAKHATVTCGDVEQTLICKSDAEIFRIMKVGRMSWLGHTERIEESRVTRLLLEGQYEVVVPITK